MDDLIAFLKARVDEDEAIATAAQAPSPWKAATHESDTWIVTDATGEPLIYDEGTPSREEAAHIARHDPARVLRDVAADRSLLAEWQKAEADPAVDDQWNAGLAAGLRLAAQIRTARYGDHPDYRPEWKP